MLTNSIGRNALLLSAKCLGCASRLQQQQLIRSTSINYDHYTSLGIPQNATQSDIKAAYYKLSMLYHPDKNQGSEEAANKFREISKAYEVLGNYRLRRLYDKGIIHTAGREYASYAEEAASPIVEDDPETKFYKSRFTKSEVKPPDGRPPIYDFDEWSRAHYGASFQRRQRAQKKWETREAMRKDSHLLTQNEILYFTFIILGVFIVYVLSAEASYDTPNSASKSRAIARHNANKRREEEELAKSQQPETDK